MPDAARDGFQRISAHDAVEHGQRVRSGFRLAFRQDVPDLVRRLHGRLLSSRSECAHHSWRIHTERTPKTQPRSAILSERSVLQRGVFFSRSPAVRRRRLRVEWNLIVIPDFRRSFPHGRARSRRNVGTRGRGFRARVGWGGSRPRGGSLPRASRSPSRGCARCGARPLPRLDGGARHRALAPSGGGAHGPHGGRPCDPRNAHGVGESRWWRWGCSSWRWQRGGARTTRRPSRRWSARSSSISWRCWDARTWV